LAKKIWKVISWILLVLTVLSIVLMLIPPSGADSPADPAAAQSFDSKLAQLSSAHQRGEVGEAHLTEAEVHSKVQQMFADAPASGLTTLSGVTVHFERDRLACVLKIKVLALPLYITLGGKPSIRQGRLEFEVTEVDLGRMPAPASVVSEALQEKLRSPEGQEMVTMPDFVTSMAVENGELVIESK
jgi:uncharacterized protein YpmS